MKSKQTYTASQKTGPLRIIWHNFTNSQRLLIIFLVERDVIRLSTDMIKSFWIGCMVAIATVMTWRTQTANFSANFKQRVIDRAINEWENNVYQGQQSALPTLVITFDIAHCSDRNTVCLKDLTFLFIRQYQLWNDASLRIAMVTASAGTLLYKQLSSNIEV